MSRHEGVSCDSCLKSNFRGRRYKCLICFDYDLCANCYEEGITSTRHTSDHPMQCILTRLDFELYYGGEVFSPEQPQSFTCPYCKKMGFSDSGLFEHVSAEHTATGVEVVCPVCAALPGGEPNLVTDDFAGHLNNEHRTGPRDLISFLDEPSAIRHGGVRRMPHSSHTGRALGGPRSRRSNMHFSASGGGISALSPSGREPVDPIAELLQQLSGGRRGAPQQSQLQQLQMQIQLERQQVSAARQQLERLPRRTHPVVTSSNSANGIGGSSSQQPNSVITFNANTIGTSSNPLPLAAAATSNINGALACLTGGSGLRGVIGSGLAGGSGVGGVSAVGTGVSGVTGNEGVGGASEAARNAQSQFLMARFMVPTLEEPELAQLERDRADRSQFVQALTISTLARHQAIDTSQEDELIADIGNLSIDVANQFVVDDQQQHQQQQQQHHQQQQQQQDGNNTDQHYKKPPLADDNIDDYVPSQTHHRGAGVGGQQKMPVNKLAGSSKQPAPQQRGQKPPPPSQSTKPARELKASMSSSKHVPDSR